MGMVNAYPSSLVKLPDVGEQEERVKVQDFVADSNYYRGNPGFICQSQAMRKLDNELARTARFDFDVLLLGETGVGKDLVASEIHRRSKRAQKTFVSVSLRSLVPTLIESELFGYERGAFSGADRCKPGIFEAAQGGTVYIPEISSLPEEIQLKLLYFMQYKRCHRVGEDPRRPERLCDVRLILATNDDLDLLVREGRLREDFFYRIKGLSHEIPALRNRIADVLPLAEHFLNLYGYGKHYTLTPDARKSLRSHHWPGNVRELENKIKSVIPFAEDYVIHEETLGLHHAVPGAAKAFNFQLRRLESLPSYSEIEEHIRKAYFEEALRRSDQHIAQAAHVAGMSEQGFRKAMRKLKLEALSSRTKGSR